MSYSTRAEVREMIKDDALNAIIGDKGAAPWAATPGHIAPQRGPGDGKHQGLEPFAIHF